MYTSIPTLWCRKLDIDSGIGGVSKAYSMLAYKHHSNTAATLAVGLHSVKSKVLEMKLSFFTENLG